MIRILRRLGWAGIALILVSGPVSRADEPDQKARLADLKRQVEALQVKVQAIEKEMEAPKKEEAKPTPLPKGWLDALKWRSIGPANMGGRIVSVAVVPNDPSTYYVATASGGLLKTKNNGVTFSHLFDRQGVVSIGDVAVSPSDPNIVWVGTGENNPRNSVSYGDGVYKSTDGGKSWTNMGLKESFQIGRIAIHPKDPNVVYVGALGRLYGPNPERGVFKTTDGGKSWEKVLFVDDKTGVIDVQMNPDHPETLLVASYERKRGLYDVNDPEVKFGPGSGLHRTTDGGKTWTKLTKGLPTCDLGRIGICYYPKNPKVVFALVESEKIGTGPPQKEQANRVYVGVSGETEEDQARLTNVVDGAPASKAGLKAGDILKEFDGKPVKTYEDFVELLPGKNPGDVVKVKVQRAGETQEVELTLAERAARPSTTGGDPKKPFLDSLGGQKENVQKRQGDEGFEYGGLYRSDDGGDSWSRINSLDPRPMYFSQVRVDPRDDQKVYVLGVSLYRSSDGGKTFKGDGGSGVHADQHALWIDPEDGRHMLIGCDGGLYVTYDRMDHWDHLNHLALGQFYDVAVDTRRVYNVYGGLQDNGTWGGPSRTLSRTGPVNQDWIRIGGGDGFGAQVDRDDPDLIYFTSQNGAVGRRNLRTGETASFRPRSTDKDKPLRFNWNTPFLLSHHNTRIYYMAGNQVFRSLDRGDGLKPISPNVTHTDRGSATALGESPRDAGVLYVGTDDGALWVSKDGGREWTDVTAKVGLDGPRFVASIEPSRYETGRVYVAFDGHRSNVDAPLAFVSEDFGDTWKPLNDGLPTRGSTRCLREDVKNPDVLYLGTEFSAFVSIDRGRTWNSLNTNLPTVTVMEFAQHPTTGEVVAATHGRSLWILDASPIRQTSAEVLKAEAHLYQPNPVQRWHASPPKGQTNRRFEGENPPNGLPIYYHLSAKPKSIRLQVLDVEGKLVRTVETKPEAGLNVAVWDLRKFVPPPRRRNAEENEKRGEASESQKEQPRPAPNRQAFGRPQAAAPGSYRIVLTIGDREWSQSVLVEPDPAGPASGVIVEEEESDEEEFERAPRIDD